LNSIFCFLVIVAVIIRKTMCVLFMLMPFFKRLIDEINLLQDERRNKEDMYLFFKG